MPWRGVDYLVCDNISISDINCLISVNKSKDKLIHATIPYLAPFLCRQSAAEKVRLGKYAL